MSREVDERALPIVAAVSRNLSRRFRGYITFEDVTQDAYLWLLERPKLHVEWLDQGKDGEKYLHKSLRRHCEREARRAKADRLGTKISDEYFYDVGRLADILPFIFNTEDWGEMPQQVETDRVSGTREPAEGGNWLASVVDVKAAYEAQPVEYRRVLMRYYHDEWSFQQIAEADQCTVGHAKKQVARGVARMLDSLGGESPWT